jgi:transcriptional regulator with XRE-family HTH domain
MLTTSWNDREGQMIEKISEKIRKLRLEKGLTLQRLAELSGFSKGYLSRIETSPTAPRLPTLQRNARAFDIDVSDFFEAPPHGGAKRPDIDLVLGRSENHTVTVESNADYSYQPLVHSYRNKYMAPYLLKIAQGRTKKFTHDSEEFMYVINGSIALRFKGAHYVLQEGDSAYFDSRGEHQVFNESPSEAVLLNVVFDFRRF